MRGTFYRTSDVLCTDVLADWGITLYITVRSEDACGEAGPVSGLTSSGERTEDTPSLDRTLDTKCIKPSPAFPL